MSKWNLICALDKVYPATGVCALIEGKQVAIFRPSDEQQVFAMDNMDPFGRSNVLSRGIICEHKDQLWVASPLKKQRFNLVDGSCLENADVSVTTYKTRIKEGQIEVQL
jgi:nitrite reductase (NADH) small subunit